MIETRTSWEDSGYDCDHCGGEINKRIDRETGQPDRVCFQCKQCGCQWTPKGGVLRIGSGRHCKTAQRQRMDPPDQIRLPRWGWIVLGVLALFVVLRLGGFTLLRFLIPLALVAILVIVVVRFGQEQEWW